MLQAAIRDRKVSSFKTAPDTSWVLDDLAERDYSLARVLRGEGGYEAEISQELARTLKRQPAGIFVPTEVLAARDLNAGTATAGGVTIEMTIQKSLIPVLRNRSVTASLGASIFEGLRGNVSIPRQTVAAQGEWLSENGMPTPTDQSFDQVGLFPKRVCGVTRFSNSLLKQSSLEIENVVRNDLVDVLALALDQAALTGTGVANNQPAGLLSYGANAAGAYDYKLRAADVTFGGAATWDGVLDFEFNCESGNVQSDGTAGYVSSPAVKRKWKGAPKITGFPSYLWESIGGEDKVNGYRALASNQLAATNKVIFSPRWSDVIIGLWPGYDLVIDRFTQMDSGTIIVTVNLLADVGFRRVLSFCASADAGNQ
jgi:hypothetical protein